MNEIPRRFADRPMVLLSNREPYEHVRTATGLTVRFPPGGLVSALDPAMRRVAGTWVAWGSGTGDRETADGDGRLGVPTEDPSYTLRRVWLSNEEVDDYYLGFSNGALWPICHMFLQYLEVRARQWDAYQTVNARFAHAVLEEARRQRDRPQIWIQDYHFALVPAAIRAAAPDLFIHHFWHIPFPPPDIYNLMPLGVQAALLRGLLGNDLLEFQTLGAARNFLDCVERVFPDMDVDRDNLRVQHATGTTHVGAFPISIDVAGYERVAREPASEALCEALRRRLASGGRQIGLSVDRIDYTKGIIRRLRALEHLWEDEPEQRGCFTMLFVTTASRSEIPAYAELEREVIRSVAEINARFGTVEWTPIVFVSDNVSPSTLPAYYRAADLCLVSSIQDGMNLVAKEFIACQVDGRGVLVLSRFTGAAEDMDGAVLVNPFFVDAFAAGISSALAMPAEERRARMEAMRARLAQATILDWLDAILARASELEAAREPRVPA